MDESKAASLLDIGPLGTDFSLKEGEKITIKVNIDGKQAKKPAAGAVVTGLAAPGSSGLKLRAPGAPAGDAAGLSGAFGGLSVGGAAGSGAGRPAAAAPAAPAPAPAAGDWVSF